MDVAVTDGSYMPVIRSSRGNVQVTGGSVWNTIDIANGSRWS